jgi:hypothetical protein
VRRRGDDFVAGFAASIIEFVVSLSHSQLDKFDKKKSSSVLVKRRRPSGSGIYPSRCRGRDPGFGLVGPLSVSPDLAFDQPV